MKRLIPLLALLAAPSWAATVVVCDPVHEAVPGKVEALYPSAHTPDFLGNANAIISPDLSAVAAVPIRYWRCTLQETVVEMTALQKAALDSWEAVSQVAAQRVSEQAKYDDDVLVKAVVYVMLGEINRLRDAICTLHPATCAQLPTLTPQQARTAIRAKINVLDSGDESARNERSEDVRRGPQP